LHAHIHINDIFKTLKLVSVVVGMYGESQLIQLFGGHEGILVSMYKVIMDKVS